MRELSAQPGTCPGFQLRRLQAGELPAGEAEAVRGHAAGCAACAGKLEALAAEQEAFRARLPLEPFAAAVTGRAARLRAGTAPRRSSLSRLVALAAPLAAAATVAFFLFLFPTSRPGGIGIKGGGHVSLLVGGTGAVRPLSDGEPLAAGERLRVEIGPGTRSYALALSVDDGGEVSVLYDAEGTSLALTPDRDNLLPDSIAFTGSGSERVYVFVTDEPLRTGAAQAALRAEFGSAGAAERMGKVAGFPGDQVTKLLRKPGR